MLTNSLNMPLNHRTSNPVFEGLLCPSDDLHQIRTDLKELVEKFKKLQNKALNHVEWLKTKYRKLKIYFQGIALRNSENNPNSKKTIDKILLIYFLGQRKFINNYTNYFNSKSKFIEGIINNLNILISKNNNNHEVINSESKADTNLINEMSAKDQEINLFRQFINNYIEIQVGLKEQYLNETNVIKNRLKMNNAMYYLLIEYYISDEEVYEIFQEEFDLNENKIIECIFVSCDEIITYKTDKDTQKNSDSASKSKSNYNLSSTDKYSNLFVEQEIIEKNDKSFITLEKLVDFSDTTSRKIYQLEELQKEYVSFIKNQKIPNSFSNDIGFEMSNLQEFEKLSNFNINFGNEFEIYSIKNPNKADTEVNNQLYNSDKNQNFSNVFTLNQQNEKAHSSKKICQGSTISDINYTSN